MTDEKDVTDSVRRALTTPGEFFEVVSKETTRLFQDTLVIDEKQTLRILTESVEKSAPKGVIKVLSASIDKQTQTASVQVEMPRWLHDRMFND